MKPPTHPDRRPTDALAPSIIAKNATGTSDIRYVQAIGNPDLLIVGGTLSPDEMAAREAVELITDGTELLRGLGVKALGAHEINDLLQQTREAERGLSELAARLDTVVPPELYESTLLEIRQPIKLESDEAYYVMLDYVVRHLGEVLSFEDMFVCLVEEGVVDSDENRSKLQKYFEQSFSEMVEDLMDRNDISGRFIKERGPGGRSVIAFLPKPEPKIKPETSLNQEPSAEVTPASDELAEKSVLKAKLDRQQKYDDGVYQLIQRGLARLQGEHLTRSDVVRVVMSSGVRGLREDLVLLSVARLIESGKLHRYRLRRGQQSKLTLDETWARRFDVYGDKSEYREIEDDAREVLQMEPDELNLASDFVKVMLSKGYNHESNWPVGNIARSIFGDKYEQSSGRETLLEAVRSMGRRLVHLGILESDIKGKKSGHTKSKTALVFIFKSKEAKDFLQGLNDKQLQDYIERRDMAHVLGEVKKSKFLPTTDF